MISGAVGDLVGQTVELGFGWRCQYDPWQTASVGVFGGVFAAGAMAFQRVLVTSCFPADTPVMTPGGEKAIQDLRAGDLVLSADPGTGKQSYQRVARTFVRKADELIQIETEDGRSVEATGEHPFFVEGKGFVAAKRLARSDLLVDDHGRTHAIVSVTARQERCTVYNLEVEGIHTYYAGGFWVHNECDPFHHIFPREFRDWFAPLVGDIDKYTMQLPKPWHQTLHRGWGGGWWNKQWADFIGANSNATREEVVTKARELMELFGLENLPYQRYPR